MDRKDPLPLSAAQSALWYAQQLDPANPIYNCAHYVEIDGPLDLRLFETALRQTVSEADSLNVEFVSGGAEVGQVFQPQLDWPLHYLDLRSAADPRGSALDWMRTSLAEPPPFDTKVITGSQLFQQALFRIADGKFLWYERIHHLLVDGFGFATVERRVADVYTQLAAGEKPVRDFGSLRALLDAESFYADSGPCLADRDYWTALFADDPEIVGLSDRSARSSHSFSRVSGELSAEASAGLSTVASAERASWPELVMAAAASYLHAMTGKSDVVLGIPIMGRLGTAAANIPATVVNVLPLRLCVRPQDSLAALVRQVCGRLRKLRTHQRYRYEQLQRDLGRLGDGRRLFGPQVNIKPFDYRLSFAGIPARTHYLAAGPVDDLELVVYARAGEPCLGVDVDANPALYDDAETAGHHRRFVDLLEWIARLSTLDTPVGSLPVATAAERRLVLTEWNKTSHPVPDVTLVELLHLDHPQWTAVEFEGREISYNELYARADALAYDLIGRGVGPGDRVAIAYERSIELVVALVGVLKAGAAYVPLDPSYPAERLAFMLSDSSPAAIVAPADLPLPISVQRLSVPVAASARSVTDADRIRTLRPEDPAYVIYTSGSTGQPKGVVIPHRGIVNRLRWMAAHFSFNSTDRVLQKTPASFDVSVWEFFLPLTLGARLVLAKPGGHRDPAYLAQIVADRRITTVHFVPSILRTLLESEKLASTELRRVICSGEELPADLVDDWYSRSDVPLHNLYGPTEASVDVTAWECATHSVTIGRPVWNTQLYVLSPGGQPLPPGATGDLYIAGVQLADGYLNRPSLTAATFRPDPFGPPGSRMYTTGDLARWNDDGSLEFRGRTDDQVKIRGQRIELGEIAAVLSSHPAVNRATVVVRDDRLVGYVVSDSPDVKDFLRLRLPDHLVPSDIVALDEFPLTPSGKLDRAALPSPGVTSGGALPRSVREEQLCGLFADVLGVSQVGIHDSFFDLGGHSLLAAKLASRVRGVLGFDVSIASIFANRTVAGLASGLTDEKHALDVLFPLRPGGQPGLFCIHPAGGIGWCYAGLLSHLDLPVYALQARGLVPGVTLPVSIEEMAAYYVREIRAIQPSGPYHLLGWSVGGVVAQEIAVQLQETGAEVGLLALLDAYPSDQWRDLPAPDEADTLRALFSMAGSDEQPVDVESTMAALRDRRSALGSLPPATLDAIPAIVANNAKLMREHRHRVYLGNALLVVAAAPREETWLDPSGWELYVDGVVERHDLGFTHPQLMTAAAQGEIGALVLPGLASSFV